MRKVLLAIILLSLTPVVSSAQTDREETKGVKVHFRKGHSNLDENYRNNKTALSEFADKVDAYYSDTTSSFRQIRVVSSVSPEGTKSVNERIAKQRAVAITNWVNNELSADLDYAIDATSVDWELLVSLVEQRDDVPHKAEVLDVLRNTPVSVEQNGVVVEKRFAELRALKGGVPYRWLHDNLFPELRYASARCEFWWETVPPIAISAPMPLRYSAEGKRDVLAFDKPIASTAYPVVHAADGWVNTFAISADDLAFTVDPNPTTKPRTTTITMNSCGQNVEIPVEQEGMKGSLKLMHSSDVVYPAKGAVDAIFFGKTVLDDVAPVAYSSVDWIDPIVSTPEGITFTVRRNPNYESRSAVITIECYGDTYEVAVNQEAAVEPCNSFAMNIKTNMLYDLAAVPNLGVEFYLGKNLSLSANYAHAWWDDEPNPLYWRYYGADVAFRWWFGGQSRIKPLQGHHVGLNYQILTYDFMISETGIMAGVPGGNILDRANHIVALEYGYSVPIARRLNLDFTIAAGYHWGLFEEYNKLDDHYVWQATKRRQYFGPTKVEISLVWLIGCDNYNKKGGKR